MLPTVFITMPIEAVALDYVVSETCGMHGSTSHSGKPFFQAGSDDGIVQTQ